MQKSINPCYVMFEYLPFILDKTLREEWPNTEFSVVRIFLYSDWTRRFAD